MRSYIIVGVTRLLIEREQPASFLLADDADVLVSVLPRAGAFYWLTTMSLRRGDTRFIFTQTHTNGSFDERLI